MHFGHPFISPPLIYYCVIPPYPCFHLEDNFGNFALNKHQEVQITDQSNKIVVTEEDLKEEGYEQTKRAWT